MARTGLGSKRECPETGRKFYDLGRDPIVSPYTGTSYELSYFEADAAKAKKAEAPPADGEEQAKAAAGTPKESAEDDSVELVSLEDAEEEEEDEEQDRDGPETSDDARDDVPEGLPDIDDEDEDDGNKNSDGDVFLEEDDGDDDLSNVVDTDDGDGDDDG